jgi:hypothetical protein
MFIYVIVCGETLKIYIGQHSGNNLQKYLQTKFSNAKRNPGSRSHLFAAMKAYPKGSWSIHPLVSDVATRTELDELERHFVRVLNARHSAVGYNLRPGGEHRKGSPPEIVRRRMSEGAKKSINPGRFRPGNVPSPLAGAKGPNQTSFKPGIVPWNTGTKGLVKPNSGSFTPGHGRGVGRALTEEHRHSLSLSHMGKSNPDKGKKRGEETKQKMKDAWVRRKARTPSL